MKTKRRAKRQRMHVVTTYGLLDTLFASPDKPMPEWKRTHQLTRMYGGLHALETAAHPTPDDWRTVSDAVNLMETLVRDMKLCEDTSGLLANSSNVALVLAEPLGELAVETVLLAQDAIRAMQARYHRTGRFGADAAALADVPPMLDFYDELLKFGSPQTMIDALEVAVRRMKMQQQQEAA